MFDFSSLSLFILASLALLIIPGPAVFYIIARSIEQGRMAGFVSTLGITFASVVHVVFAALGLSALIVQSAIMFSIVKYVGAAYLIYLGIRTLMVKNSHESQIHIESLSLGQMFWQGFIVNMLNPKTAIFFLAFLPQFVDPQRGHVTVQFLILGLIFVVLAITSDSMYAMVAGSAKSLLTKSRRIAKTQKLFSGFVYIGLGISTMLFSFNQSIKVDY